MKATKITSVLETTMGPIVVSTEYVPWWLAILTFGLFQKIICRVDGPAFIRYQELRRQWSKRFNLSFHEGVNLEKTAVFHTTYSRIRFWHKHMKEYAKVVGETLSDCHYTMQLFCELELAEQSHNTERARKIRQEINEHSKKQDRFWRRFLNQ